MGQHHHRDLLGDGIGHRLRLRGAQLIALPQQPDQPLGHVQIGGEIAVIRQDHLTARAHLQRRRQCLVDLDRQRVAGGDRARRRADQFADPVAHHARQLHPSGAVPRLDQLAAPFGAHHVAHALHRALGQRPQRVAVEVNHALGQIEEILPGQGCIAHRHNSPRKCHSSGNSSTSSIRRRYCTPEVPPVPRLKPITRSTVVTWLNRQRRK